MLLYFDMSSFVIVSVSIDRTGFTNVYAPTEAGRMEDRWGHNFVGGEVVLEASTYELLSRTSDMIWG